MTNLNPYVFVPLFWLCCTLASLDFSDETGFWYWYTLGALLLSLAFLIVTTVQFFKGYKGLRPRYMSDGSVVLSTRQ